MLIEWGLFIAIGLIAGLLSGILGLGGGLVIVPSLLLVFGWQGLADVQLMHSAIATSLMVIALTSLVSTCAHQQQHNVNWPVVRRLTPGLITGGFIGAYSVTILAGQVLKLLFASYMLLVAIRMWWPILPRVSYQCVSGRGMLFAVGNAIGSMSALVGIGGGTLTVPYLLMMGQSMTRAIGTSAVCGFPISVAAGVSFLLFYDADNVSRWQSGFIHWQAVLSIASSSIIFAVIGAKLINRLPLTLLRRLFSLVLMTGSVYLIYQ